MPWMPNDTTVARWDELKANRKIGRWPRAESARIDARFRMLHVEGTPNPIASRYVVRIFPFTGSTEDFFAIIDLAYVPAADHLFGTSGVNVDGREVTLTVTQYDPGVDPIFSDRGIMFDFTYQKDAGGISHAYFMSSVDIFGDFNVPYRPFSLGTTPNWLKASLGPEAPTDWTTTPVHIGFHWITMSDCYVLEEQAAPAPPSLFAELNGIDSKITFIPRSDSSGTRWKIEFEIRPHGNSLLVVLGNVDFSTTVFGFEGINIRWHDERTSMGSALPLDVWTTVRFEHGFDADDNTYRVFWDDVPKGTRVENADSKKFSAIGVRKTTIEGEFDLRNLLFTITDGITETVLMDLPLTVNACDEGPKAMIGTTFNMDLPSCP